MSCKKLWKPQIASKAGQSLTAMANFSPTHARTPPPKGTQASGVTSLASGVPSMNLSGMKASGSCSSRKGCHAHVHEGC